MAKEEKALTQGYLDGKIDSLLEAVSFRFDSVDYEFGLVRSEIRENREKIEETRNLLNGYVKSKEDSGIESTVLRHRVDRLEKKVGIDS